MKQFLGAMCFFAILGGTAHAKPAPKNTGKPILPIAIVINGTRQAIEPPPRFYRNQLLVPVRRILSALGLAFERQGKQITTSAGAKTFVFTVGSTAALIDGKPVILDAPPVEIQNVLYAPLRFFAQALDAQAVYNRQSNAVEIISTLLGRSGNGIVSENGGVEAMGDVAAIDVLSDPPTITLTSNASARTIPIAPNATIYVQDVITGTSNPAELTDLHAGDYAHVYLDRDRKVKEIVGAYGSRTGKIAAAAGGEIVLQDGQVIVPSRETTVTLNAAPVPIERLSIGDSVMVRYNIDSSQPREIIATRAGATAAASSAGPTIAGLDLAPDRPLRQNDQLFVTLRGTPGGAATFDIGPYVVRQPMHEDQPGQYSGAYTVRRGVNFSDTPVFGHLSLRGTEAAVVSSTRTVSVSTSPPGIGDFAPDAGAIVNSVRPSVYVTFTSGTVPVNASSEQLVVNGHDVTSESTRTPLFIQYTPGVDLPRGDIRVSVRVADRAGNAATKSWSFAIR